MAEQLQTIFILITIYQVKHFMADFPLQNNYMLQKDQGGWKFIAPLSLHCGIHAVMTLLICMVFNPQLWWLALVDFVVHFFMDRIKAAPKYLGRFDDKESPAYWNCLGFDQMVHHLTHAYIIWWLIK